MAQSSFNFNDVKFKPRYDSRDEIRSLGNLVIGLDPKKNIDVCVHSFKSDKCFHPTGNSQEFYLHPNIFTINGIVRIFGIQSPINLDQIEDPKLKKICEPAKGYHSALIEKEYLKFGPYFSSHGIDSHITPTVRSKLIYGVAAIMNRLHKMNIIHLDLLNNIYLDDNYEPRINLSEWSFFIKDELSLIAVDTPIPLSAPEFFESNDHIVSFPSDVYSFAYFLYQLFSHTVIRRRSVFQSFKQINSIPNHYWELIERCWQTNPADRPTFAEIVEILRDDKFAINESDLDQLHEYRERIDKDVDEFAAKINEPILNSINKSQSIDYKSIILKKTQKKIDLGADKDFHEDPAIYINQGQIGQGVTCITYKLINKKTNIPICKKIINFRGEQYVVKNTKRVLKEFKVLYKMKHPCICQAYGINTAEPNGSAIIDGIPKESTTIALYLEFLEISLNDVLKMKITDTMRTKIVLEIVHAMKHLHEHGIIHRDLKIANIMLNSVFETKLVDFGLVRITGSAIENYSFVEDSLSLGVGTPNYMSPEMIGDDVYSFKTDVFSFGVVMYIIFIGTIPKQTFAEKLMRKKITVPAASQKMNEFCRSLIIECLEPDPENRPTFAEILDDMRKHSYMLSSNVDPSIISQRDEELTTIENLL